MLFHFKKITCLFIFFYVVELKAQDPHFTQYYSSPILMNPALTGFFNGDVRSSGSYRNQWPSLPNPYLTGTFSVDANILKSVIKDGDIAGFGFTGLFDKTNGGGLKTNSLSGSISFHKLLDANGVNRIGIGAMATYTTRLLDYSKFTFAQQLTPLGFDITLPTGEPVNGFSTSYVDYSVGIIYSAITDISSFYCGGSLYHFNKPAESFNGPIHQIQPRIVFNAGTNFQVGEENRMYLSGAYMNSEFSSDLIFGAAFSRALSQIPEENYNVILGGWYRYNDAIAPYVGLEFKNIRAGISYDINVSKLTSGSSFRGGFEFSLSYIFTRDVNANLIKQTLCPKGSSQLRWFGY